MSVIRELAELVAEHYVLPDAAAAYAHTLRENASAIDALPDIALTNQRLHAAVPDRHLSIRTHTVRTPPPPPPAGGIASVRRSADGTGVLQIAPFLDVAASATPYLDAAFTLLHDARRLVLDLRACGGGDTDTVARVHGFLLGPEPVHLGVFQHRGSPDEDHVSVPGVPGFAGPLAVLTSARTFSGGEDLAYILQALGRARVYGEQTGGGAHPVEPFELTGGLVAQIPVARSVVDATGGNWEGTGVTPDVPCPADDALERALSDLG